MLREYVRGHPYLEHQPWPAKVVALYTEMAAQGYHLGVTTLLEALHEPICAAAHCPTCGHRGLAFHPFRRQGDSPLPRLFVACHACGEYVSEF